MKLEQQRALAILAAWIGEESAEVVREAITAPDPSTQQQTILAHEIFDLVGVCNFALAILDPSAVEACLQERSVDEKKADTALDHRLTYRLTSRALPVEKVTDIVSKKAERAGWQ